MGSWGIKALESDAGLDVIDFLKEHIPENYNLKFSEIITELKRKLLGETFDDIDYLYDNTAMALVELYFMFKDNGELAYDDENEKKSLRKNIKKLRRTKNHWNIF
jgi:hypothetical protein